MAVAPVAVPAPPPVPGSVSVYLPGTADLDWYLYTESDTFFYEARGYSAYNPEVGSYYAPAAGTYYV